MKKGYLLLKVSVLDPNLFKTYPVLSESIIAKYGGKYIFRGGKFDEIEGKWPEQRNVLVEFESVSRAKEFYNSEEYQEALKIRQTSTKTDLIIIEGY